MSMKMDASGMKIRVILQQRKDISNVLCMHIVDSRGMRLFPPVISVRIEFVEYSIDIIERFDGEGIYRVFRSGICEFKIGIIGFFSFLGIDVSVQFKLTEEGLFVM